AATEPVPPDACYLYNFDDPRRPRLLTLPAGRGAKLRDRMAQLSRELRVAIPAALETEQFRNRKEALEDDLKGRRERALKAFERRALTVGVGLIRTPLGVGLAPVHDGKTLDSAEIEALPEAERVRLREAASSLGGQLAELLERDVPRWEREHRDALRQLVRETTRHAAGHLIDEVRADFEDLPAVIDHLARVADDVVENALELMSAPEPSPMAGLPGAPDSDLGPSFKRYRVNLIVDNSTTTGAPVVFEDNPTEPNLVGRIEHSAYFGTLTTDFTLIRSGAIHRSNGGYLVLDARKLLSQPFAWDELKRCLRNARIRIEPLGERLGLVSTVSLEPEPMPIAVKVVLTGDRLAYYLLSALDPDFLELFKVQADFDDEVGRTRDEEQRFVRLFGTVAQREGLRPLDRAAAAGLVEYAARLAGDGERLSIHMRSLTDVLREADFRAAAAGRDRLTREDVDGAIGARRHRASRVRERILDEIGRGRILLAVEGAAGGQVNGLTVGQLGETSMGWPTRITARVGLGGGEIVDIERKVELGGPIHSKGVLILEGFINGRFGREAPLALEATLVFEQSYGSVEGDSASLAETCALLSAIAEVPVGQAWAVTGSINQLGEVQPVGGVNEKIEGFFDACLARGAGGRHGVILPAANVADLMLREDVAAAVRAGSFAVVAVTTIDDALEILAGMPAGERGADGAYPASSVNGRVAAGLQALAERARSFAAPAMLAAGATNGRRAAARRRRTSAGR
ncbi:MAG: ATP-dependent protease, partial [Chloroflexi bacterium]|nr:ATP-dependent protease [Chloroflexota bacterium]